MPGRILVVDDVATNRIVMKVKLCASRYDVVCAASGAEALTIAQAGGIDAIIMDMVMPGASGAEICRALRADPATRGIPVVLITAVDDPATRVEGLEAGADDFLTRPVDEVALLARVRSLLRSREEERDFEARGGWLGGEMDLGGAGAARTLPMADNVMPFPRSKHGVGPTAQRAQPPVPGRVALLDSDPAVADALSTLLSPAFLTRPAVLTADEALAQGAGEAADVFLIDADLGGRNEGMRLMSELRSRPPTRRAACVILMPPGESDRAANALDLGAADVVHRPLLSRELAVRLRTQLARKQRGDQMRDALEQGLRLAVVDPLTGLYNRRYGLHHLERVAARCRSQAKPAGVILMDLDHFKTVNDVHGHPVGDRVLTEVAQVMRANLRVEDLVCRIGGEEFLAVLPDATLEQVYAVAERLRGAIADLCLPLRNGFTLRVTTSLGITALEERDDAGPRALDRADRALYDAKRGGRDRIGVAELDLAG